jgi:hypothetical protein
MSSSPITSKDSYLKAIGLVTVEWTQFSTSIESAIWQTAELDPQVGRCFTNGLNMPSLLNILRTIVHTKIGDHARLDALDRLIHDVDDVRRARNELNHSLLAFSEHGSAFLLSASAKKELKIEVSNKYQTPDDVEQVAKRIMALDQSLNNWLAVWRNPTNATS